MITTPSDLDILEHLPGHDCGMCGSPTCAIFARRVGAGIDAVERCGPLEDPTTVRNMVKRGIIMGICDEAAARGTVEMNPCAEGDKITLETQMKCSVTEKGCSRFDLLDLQYARHYLSPLDRGGTLTVSPAMGYARWEDGGQRIHLFKRGKLIVRRADSREAATELLKRISRVVWPMVICPETGYTLSNSIYNEPCPFTWRPYEWSGEIGSVRVGVLDDFWRYTKAFPNAGTDMRERAFADVVNALTSGDDPQVVKSALSAAGALEAMVRLKDVGYADEGGWKKMLEGRGVLPPPSSEDCQEHRVEKDLRIASLCLLSLST